MKKMLKSCPFCGNKKAVEIINDADTEEELNFFCIEEFKLYYHIICNAYQGGCSVSSGFFPTKGKAIEA